MAFLRNSLVSAALRSFYLITLSLLFFSSSAIAGEGEKLLNKFLTDIKTMQATFVQTLRTNEGEVLQESLGMFYLQRPGRFRWNYSLPYPQEIVSDGKHVWIYDVELQQVTMQEQSASLSNTPMALMRGKLDLGDAYVVNELDNRAGVYRLRLSSKSGDADFSEVIVGVDKNGLRFLQLRDQFEQTTDIVFNNLKSNMHLDNKLFNFVPPEGVDVIGGS